MISTDSAIASSSALTAGILQFIKDLPFKISVLLVFLYLLLLWLLLVRYVYLDAKSRSEDELFRRFSLISVILFNFPGLLLYFILRPHKTFKQREREDMEEEIINLELARLREGSTVNKPGVTNSNTSGIQDK